MSGDLSAKLLVAACVRAAAAKGCHAMVLRRGDPDRGMVYVKVMNREGAATLFQTARDFDGRQGWRVTAGPAPKPEAEIDAKIFGDARIDPDLWAVEVLDDGLEHPLAPDFLAD